MNSRKTTILSSVTKTVIIIIGILVAAILAYYYTPAFGETSSLGSFLNPGESQNISLISDENLTKLVELTSRIVKHLPGLGS